MTAAFDRLPAALADRYRLERELGQGGMATVYLAHDLRHDRKVAVKVLRAELAAALGPERFLREIKIAANLQHPHILALYDSGEADGFLYYVMPFVDGESLRDKLRRERALAIPEAVRLLRDVADALAAAHQHGVVHRDIKPENIMLSGRHALVTDFGVAKAVSTATGSQSQTTAGMALGTPAYMAPEQAMADPNMDHRADIYAFGVLAYELLTGLPPFTGSTPQSVVAAQITTPAVPVTDHRSEIPSALAALVMKCLEKKPADRWQSAEDLIPALETAMTPSGGMTAPAKSGGQRRILALGLGVLVAAAAAFVLWRKPASPRDAPTPAEPKSIAVLPLVNVGGDSTQDYYADGVSEELANALGKVPGLQVAARTSSFSFKGRTNLDVSEVGQQLNVGVVLQGSVRRLGDRVRLSVQLTDTRRRVELWSESYDQEEKELYAIQDSITSAIVRQLALALGTARRTERTHDPEAHDLYLRGLALTNRGLSEQDIRGAMTYYHRALEKDPEYVEAWLGVASSYTQLADAYQPSGPAYDSTRMAAREVLARDSLNGEAFAHLANAAGAVDWDFEESNRLFRRAIELAPNSVFTHAQYGLSACASGRIDDGLAITRRGVELDPLYFYAKWSLLFCLYLGRRYNEAIAEQGKDSLIWQNVGDIEDVAAAATREIGRYPEALRLYEKVHLLSYGYAITLARMGRKKEARDVLAQLTSMARERYVNPMMIAFVYANLSERDKAFEWLERALTDRTAWVTAIPTWPELDPIRSDPRFAALLKRVGLPEVKPQ